jgi:flagellin-like hook-associated protein FlgL
VIAGFSASASGLSISDAAGAWATSVNINTAVTALDTALDTLRANTSTLSSNLAIVNARQEFTTNMVNTLTGGADSLTLADMNEEGANMLMLQTRQALSTTALSMSAQAAQSVLRLF